MIKIKHDKCCFHLGEEFLNLMDGSAMLEVESVFVKPDKSFHDYLEVRINKLKNLYWYILFINFLKTIKHDI